MTDVNGNSTKTHNTNTPAPVVRAWKYLSVLDITLTAILLTLTLHQSGLPLTPPRGFSIPTTCTTLSPPATL